MGVLDRREREKNNETGLKDEGGIEMSTTVLPLRDARSPSLDLLTIRVNVHSRSRSPKATQEQCSCK